MNVSDEAVEAAREAAWERYGARPDRSYLKTIFKAAAPYLMAAAWDEAFKKGADWVESAGEHSDEQADWTNPYRSAGGAE